MLSKHEAPAGLDGMIDAGPEKCVERHGPVLGGPPDEADVPLAMVPLGHAVLVQHLPSVPEREPDARSLYVRRAGIDQYGVTMRLSRVHLSHAGRASTASRGRIEAVVTFDGYVTRLEEGRARKRLKSEAMGVSMGVGGGSSRAHRYRV